VSLPCPADDIIPFSSSLLLVDDTKPDSWERADSTLLREQQSPEVMVIATSPEDGIRTRSHFSTQEFSNAIY